MISYVTGTLGAGKTFHSVRLGCRHLAKGGTVVTNVECDYSHIRAMIARRDGVWIQPEQLRVFDPEKTPQWEMEIPWGEAEGNVLVILDEAHLFYNSRDWAQTAANNRRLLEFLTQSRKAGVDVIWITQEGANVDKQFRVLAEWELAIVSTAHLPLGFLGKLPFRAYCVKKVSSRGNYLVHKEWFRYSKYLFGAYKTDSMLSQRMRDLAQTVERCGFLKLQRVTVRQKLAIELRAFWHDFTFPFGAIIKRKQTS
jgi:hypothetical protein